MTSLSRTIYFIIGSPGSGKSWVCDQLRVQFTYIPHDLYINLTATDSYLQAIQRASQISRKPLLIETPFSISKIKDPLESLGFKVIPVFIQEDPNELSNRYYSRNNTPIPKGHLTRQNTYQERAKQWNAFIGTSDEVYQHLLKTALDWKGLWG